MPLHRLFFYLTIILLPTQLGKHFWPDWAFVVGRRVDYLSPTIFLTDITIFLTLLFWFLSFKKHFRFSIGHWYYLILVLFVVLNILFAISPFVAFYRWIKVLEFVLFGVYIVKTKPHVRNILIGLSVAVFYSSLIAIVQFFSQRSIGGIFWVLGERTFTVTTPGIARIQIFPYSIFHSVLYIMHSSELLRPYATFPHPNVLGGFLAIMLPLIIWNSMLPLSNKISISQRVKRLSFIDKAKPWTQRAIKFLELLRIPTIILGFSALILTFSRSAWIAGVVGTIFVFIILKRKKILDYWYYWILVFIGLFIAALPYFQTLTPNSESVYVRNELNTAAIKMVLPENYDLRSKNYELFLGVGLGNYLVELPIYYPHREIFFLQPVHNIYVLLLSETGIVGLGISLYLFYIFFRHALHKRQFSIFHYALCIMLLLGVVDHYPLTTQQGQLFLTLLISLSLL